MGFSIGVSGKENVRIMREICNNMGDSLKEFWHVELDNIKKEMGELKQEVCVTSQKIEQIEGANRKTEKELQLMKEQNKEICQSVTLLECKVMENYLRLRGIPEEEGKNIHEIVVEKIAHYLEEPSEDISFNIETIYRVNSNMQNRESSCGM